MVGAIDKHFKLKDYTPLGFVVNAAAQIDKHFKLKDYTPVFVRLTKLL